jgi:16S rRNA (cytidine1402-2'-O)-methyltransferase
MPERNGKPPGTPDAGRSGGHGVRVQRSFDERKRPGTLYLVATPIGNLEDMTMRAIRTLREADLIAAEDTRQTRKLLSHFDIHGRLVSYHEHNKDASGPELIRLLEEGRSIALVTDAGTPAVSDPGAELAAEAAARGIPVVPIPGANAALSALIISGLPTHRFLFAGFPPRDRKGMDRLLDSLEAEPGTIILYESPHRVRKTLEALAERWGGRRMALVRELTKRHEEAVRGTVADVRDYAAAHPPIGECVLVIEGAAERPAGGTEEGVWWERLTIAEHVARYESLGLDRREAMKRAAADRGLKKRDIYAALLEAKADDGPDRS